MARWLGDGGMSRAAKGADCKSAGLRLRRFESYFPHHPGEVKRCGCSSMVEQQPSKLMTRVRFPSPAPTPSPLPSKGLRGVPDPGDSPRTSVDTRAIQRFTL